LLNILAKNGALAFVKVKVSNDAYLLISALFTRQQKIEIKKFTNESLFFVTNYYCLYADCVIFGMPPPPPKNYSTISPYSQLATENFS